MAVDATYYSGHWTFQTVGTARTATTLATTAAAAPTALAIYPNPVSQGTCSVVLPTAAATAHLRLFDSQGRLVVDQESPLAGNQATLEIRHLAKGLYLLQATAGSATYTGKVAVE